MKKLLLLLPLAAVAVIGWGIFRKNTPPAVNFSRVKRETLVSTLPTNGKVEPIQWQAVSAQAAGLVTRVDAVEGGAVANGGLLAATTDPSLQADIDTAKARVAEAEAPARPDPTTMIECLRLFAGLTSLKLNRACSHACSMGPVGALESRIIYFTSPSRTLIGIEM